MLWKFFFKQIQLILYKILPDDKNFIYKEYILLILREIINKIIIK